VSSKHCQIRFSHDLSGMGVTIAAEYADSDRICPSLFSVCGVMHDPHGMYVSVIVGRIHESAPSIKAPSRGHHSQFATKSKGYGSVTSRPYNRWHHCSLVLANGIRITAK
jgi:hypothetical protein